MSLKLDYQEIINNDPCGNMWKIALYKMDTKSNRFQLSFFFNEKEFPLCKLQSNRSASDLWELVESLRKSEQATLTPETPVEATNATESPISMPKTKERPKRRVA